MLDRIALVIGAIIVAASATLPAPSSAAVVSLTHTLNLNDASGFHDQEYAWDYHDFPSTSVTLSEGDTLDWTIRLQAGQSITLVQPRTIQAALDPTFFTGVIFGTQTLFLLNDLGETIGSVSQPGGTPSIFEGLFFNDALAGLGAPFSFSGVRMVLPVADFTRPGVTSTTYVQPFFAVAGACQSNCPLPGVPEPGTWTLFIVGFGLAGLMLRRRRGNPSHVLQSQLLA